MGAWSAGISGNDTAMDLRTAYSEAFATWDVETALKKIDQYKWTVMRKVCDSISYRSKIVPEVQDIWPNFQLYGKIFDDCPALEQIRAVPWAKAVHNKKGVFFTEGNMRYFNKRNARVIGKYMTGIEEAAKVNALNDAIFFSARSPLSANAETRIINAILDGK